MSNSRLTYPFRGNISLEIINSNSPNINTTDYNYPLHKLKDIYLNNVLPDSDTPDSIYIIDGDEENTRYDFETADKMKNWIYNLGHRTLTGNVKIISNDRTFTDMSKMFYLCLGIKSLDLSKFDTSNVTTLSNMLYNCNNLQSINLSNFDTSNVINMDNVFFENWNLISVDVSSFDTSKVTNMMFMFKGCRSLTHLDLSSFVIQDSTNVSVMVHDCNNITTAYARTQKECDILNNSDGKSNNITFVVKS